MWTTASSMTRRRFAAFTLFLQLFSIVPPAWAVGPAKPQEVGRHRAVIEAVTGAVEIQRAGDAQWNTASPGLDLQIGDRLRTDSSAAARVKIGDVGVMEITPSTEIRIRDLKIVRAVLRAYLVLTRMTNRDDIDIELVRGETRQSFVTHEGRTANYKISSREGDVTITEAATFSTKIGEPESTTAEETPLAISWLPSSLFDEFFSAEEKSGLKVTELASLGEWVEPLPDGKGGGFEIASALLHGGVIGAAEKLSTKGGEVTMEMVGTKFVVTHGGKKFEVALDDVSEASGGKRTHYGARGLTNALAKVSGAATVVNVLGQTAGALVEAAMTKALNPTPQPTKLEAVGLKGASTGSVGALFLVVKFLDASGKGVEIPSSAARDVTVELVSGPTGGTVKTATFKAQSQSDGEISNLPTLTGFEKPGTYKLRFSSTGLTPAEADLQVKAGRASKLVILTQPAGAEPGKAFKTQPRLQLQDASGNAAAAYPNIKVEIASGSGKVIDATNGKAYEEVQFSGGTLTLENLAIEKAGTYTLKFTDQTTNLTVTSASFTVAEAVKPAVKLRFSGTPRTTFTAGVDMPDREFLVEIVDADGKLALGDADKVREIMITAAKGDPGVAGTSKVKASGSQAAFHSAIFQKPGTHKIKFSSAGLPDLELDITVAAAAANGPTMLDVYVIKTLTPLNLGCVVRFQDAGGKDIAIPASAPRDVTVALVSGPGTLTGPTTIKATGNEVDLSKTKVTKPGKYTFKFTSPGLKEATAEVPMIIGPPVSMQMSRMWDGTATAGEEMRSVTLEFFDEASNKLSRVSGREVTVALVGSGELKGTKKITMASGLWAQFEDLIIEKAGTYTLKFTSAGCKDLTTTVTVKGSHSPAKLVVLTQPSGGEPGKAFTTQPKVGFFDKFGNPSTTRTNITVSIASGSGKLITTKKHYADADNVFYLYTDADGTVDFGKLGLGADKAGTYTLKFTTESGSNLTATSNSFTVAAAAVPKKLGFYVDYAKSIKAGAVILRSIKFLAADGTDVSAQANAEVTVSIVGGGAELKGKTKVAAKNSPASFEDLKIEKAGTYKIRYSSPGLESIEEEITVTALKASALEIVTQPAGGAAGQAFTTQPKLRFKDQYGNPASLSLPVVAKIASGSGKLVGKIESTQGADGMVAFTDLGIDKAGIMTIQFSSSEGTITATSNAFTVTAAAAAKLRFSGSPRTTFTAGVDMPDREFLVEIVDAQGNLAGGDADKTREITISSVAGEIGIKGTPKLKASGSQAAFHNVIFEKAGTHKIKFSSAGLPDLELEITVAAPPLAVPTAAQIGAMTPEEFAKIPAEAFAKMSDPQFKAFKPDQLKAMTAAQFGVLKETVNFALAFKPNQLAAFSPENIKNLQPNQLGRFSNDQLKALTTEQRAALTEDQKKSLSQAQKDLLGIRPPPIGEITVESFKAMMPAAINKLSVEDFKKIPAAAIAAARPAQLKAFRPEHMTAMSDEQFKAVVENTNVASMFSAAQIAGIKPEHIKMLPTTHIARLTNEQLSAMTKEQAEALTANQLAALTPEKKKLLKLPAVVAPVATKLSFTTQPAGATAGTAFTTQPVVTVQDASGNKVSSTASVSIAIKSGTGASGAQLLGTKTVTAVAGVATFAGLSINNAGAGYVLEATSGTLTAAASNAIAVAAAAVVAPARMSVTSIWNARADKYAGTQRIAIEFLDAAGQLFATGDARDITVALVGSGELRGTKTVRSVNGQAHFRDLVIERVGTYSLRFTSPGVPDYTLENIRILPNPVPTTLEVVTQPVGGMAGQPLATQPRVRLLDRYGNLMDGSTILMNVAIASGSGTLSRTKGITGDPIALLFENGVADCSSLGLAINNAGSYTLKFTLSDYQDVTVTSNSFTVAAPIAAAKPTTLTTADVKKMTAAEIAAITPEQFAKLPADAFGELTEAQMKAITADQIKVMTSAQTEVFKGAAIISVMFTPAKIAAITPANLKLYQKTQISRMSDDQLKALTTEQRAALTTEQKSALSTAQKILLGFEKAPEVASKLAITAQPTKVTAGAVFSPKFAVAIQSASGTTMTTATSEVTVEVASGPGALLGTAKVAAKNGVATFSDLKIEKAGKYTLKFSSGTLTAAPSAEFEIVAGEATTAVIVGTQTTSLPSGITGSLASSGGGGPGTMIASPLGFPQVYAASRLILLSLVAAVGDLTIEYQDAFGNRATATNGAGTVTIKGKQLNVTITNGRATISSADLTAAGVTSPYKLDAASAGGKAMKVEDVTASSATASAALPAGAKLYIENELYYEVVNEVFARPLAIYFVDASTNLIKTDAEVTASIASGSGNLLGTTKIKAADGVAMFKDLKIDAMGSYKLKFSANNGAIVLTTNEFSVSGKPPKNMSPPFVTPRSGEVGVGDIITCDPGKWEESPTFSFKWQRNNYELFSISHPEGSTVNIPGADASTYRTTLEDVGKFIGGVAIATNPYGEANYGALGGGQIVGPKVVLRTASKLAATTQPAGGVTGSALTTPPAASFQDDKGNIVATVTDEVTVSLASGTGNLSGTTKVKAVYGVATFPDLKIDKAGTYTFKFTSGSMSATSNAFTVVDAKDVVLTPAQLRAMSVAEFTKIPAEAFAKFTDQHHDAISVEQYKAMTEAQFKVMTQNLDFALYFQKDKMTKLSAFTPANVKLIPGVQLARFSEAQLRALTRDQVAALTDEQKKALTEAQRQILGLVPKVDESATITAAQFEKLVPAEINKLSVERFKKIAPDAFTNARMAQVVAFKPEHIKALSDEQFMNLKDNEGLLTGAIYLKNDQVAAFKPEHVRLMSVALLKRLKLDQLKAMTPDQVAALTDEQKAALGSKLNGMARPSTWKPAITTQTDTSTRLPIITQTDTSTKLPTITRTDTSTKLPTITRTDTSTTLATAARTDTATPAVTGAKLAVTTEPSGATTAKQTFATQPVVTVRTADGKTVEDYVGKVKVAVTGGSGNLQGTKEVDVKLGIARFTDLRIDEAGENTLTFTADGAIAATSNLRVGPIISDLTATVPQIRYEQGASVSVTFAWPEIQAWLDAVSRSEDNRPTWWLSASCKPPSGDDISASIEEITAEGGVRMSFSLPSDAPTGIYRPSLWFRGPGDGGSPRVKGGRFTVGQDLQMATSLQFSDKTIEAVENRPFAAQPTVTVHDAVGHFMPYHDLDDVTLTLKPGTGTAGAKLIGTTKLAFDPGYGTQVPAQFSDLAIDKPGKYVLVATAGNLPPIEATINVAAATTPVASGATAAKLAITAQPTKVTAGQVFSPKFTVAIQSASNATVTTATNEVTVVVSSGPGVLLGTAKVAAKNGVAAFSDLKIEKAGKYKLTFSSGSLTAATSAEFEIEAGEPSRIVIVGGGDLSALPSGISGSLASAGGGGPGSSDDQAFVEPRAESDRAPILAASFGAPVSLFSLHAATQVLLNSLIAATGDLVLEIQDAFGNKTTSSGPVTLTLKDAYGRDVTITVDASGGSITIPAATLRNRGLSAPYNLSGGKIGSTNLEAGTRSGSTSLGNEPTDYAIEVPTNTLRGTPVTITATRTNIAQVQDRLSLKITPDPGGAAPTRVGNVFTWTPPTAGDTFTYSIALLANRQATSAPSKQIQVRGLTPYRAPATSSGGDVSAGPEGTVDVVIQSSANIGAYQATINFDANFVNVDPAGVTGGTGAGFTAVPTSVNVDNVGGSITINAFQIGSNPTGRFTVARIPFTPVAKGVSALSLSGAPDAALFNTAGGDITIDANNKFTLTRSSVAVGENRIATITSLSPLNVSKSANGFTLTVRGQNFAQDAVVSFGGTNLTTTYVSARELKASVPASLLTTGGVKAVIVTNPAPGGGASSDATLNVLNPTPSISSISPTSATAGTTSLTLTVNGRNFVPTSQILVGGKEWPTTMISDARLTASLPSGTALTGGVFAVLVFNPEPGGGRSNSRDLTVSGEQLPLRLSVSAPTPASPTVGADFSVMVNGLGYGQRTVSLSPGPVTLSLSGGAAGTTLEGTIVTNGVATATVANGVATFSGLRISSAGQGYTLTANANVPATATTAAAVLTGQSEAFAVAAAAGTASSTTVAGMPTKITFAQEPAGAVAGTVFRTQPIIEFLNASNQRVSGADGGTANLTFERGVQQVTASASISNGVATFTGVKLDEAGEWNVFGGASTQEADVLQGPDNYALVTPTVSLSVSAASPSTAAVAGASSVAPTVTSVVPANGATNVPVGTTVTITFSKSMMPIGTPIRISKNGTEVNASHRWSAGNRSVEITPVSPATPFDTGVYTVTVAAGTNGARDTAGVALAQAFTSTFTVGAASASTSAASAFPALDTGIARGTLTATPSTVERGGTVSFALTGSNRSALISGLGSVNVRTKLAIGLTAPSGAAVSPSPFLAEVGLGTDNLLRFTWSPAIGAETGAYTARFIWFGTPTELQGTVNVIERRPGSPPPSPSDTSLQAVPARVSPGDPIDFVFRRSDLGRYVRDLGGASAIMGVEGVAGVPNFGTFADTRSPKLPAVVEVTDELIRFRAVVPYGAQPGPALAAVVWPSVKPWPRPGGPAALYEIVARSTPVAPTITITASDNDLSVGEVATLVFTLSQASSNFTAADIVVSGGKLSGFSAISSTVYTATFTPTPNSTTTATINVADGGFTNGAGDMNTAATPLNISVNTVAAAATTTPTVANPIANQTFDQNASFSFVVPENTFTSADGSALSYALKVGNNATLPPWISFDAATRTIGGRASNGEVGVHKLVLTARDARGLSVDDDFTLTVRDVNDPPAAKNQIAAQTAALNSRFEFTLPSGSTTAIFVDPDLDDQPTYSAKLTNNAELPEWLRFDAATLTFSGTPSNQNAGDIFDILVTAKDASNASANATFKLTITAAAPGPPTVVITTNDNTLTSGEQATLTFTLSEASSNFAAGDISVSGGTLSGFSATSSTVYTATLTPTPNSTSTASISVAGSSFTNGAGDANVAATPLNIRVDTVRPAVVITTNDNDLTSGEVATLTFTLSEASANFTAADISVSGGTLSGFSATSSTVYTATFTPTPNSTTTATINVAAAAFTDAAGNTNVAATSLSITINTVTAAASSTATKLVITKMPTTATAGVAFATSENAVRITAKTAQDTTVSTVTGDVTVSMVTKPEGGAFKAGSVLTQALADGEADFTNLGLTTAGAYTLRFSSGSLAAAEATITVTAASDTGGTGTRPGGSSTTSRPGGSGSGTSTTGSNSRTTNLGTSGTNNNTQNNKNKQDVTVQASPQYSLAVSPESPRAGTRAAFTLTPVVVPSGGTVTVTASADPVAAGTTLTAKTEGWSGDPTFTYAWQRGEETIADATSATYKVGTADSGKSLACVVTATNKDGSASAKSNAIAIPALAPAQSDLKFSIDGPTAGQVISTQPFIVSGWAVDLNAASGPGVDAFHIYTFNIVNGQPDPATAKFVTSGTVEGSRPDVGAVFGSQFTKSGFTASISDLAPGTYDLGVYFHSTVTAQFYPKYVRITVPAPPAPVHNAKMSLDGPTEGQVIDRSVTPSFITGGWAVDLGATSGVGVDAIHVYAFPIENGVVGAGKFIDQATLGGSRPDVAAVFGSQFQNSGFNFLFNTTLLTPGEWYVGVYVHSSVTGQFDANDPGQTKFVKVTITGGGSTSSSPLSGRKLASAGESVEPSSVLSSTAPSYQSRFPELDLASLTPASGTGGSRLGFLNEASRIYLFLAAALLGQTDDDLTIQIWNGEGTGVASIPRTNGAFSWDIPSTLAAGTYTAAVLRGTTQVSKTVTFTIQKPEIAITTLTPASGGRGDQVTAEGTGFTDQTTIKVGDADATITQRSATSIKFTVPASVPYTGITDVNVVARNGEASSAPAKFGINALKLVPNTASINATSGSPFSFTVTAQTSNGTPVTAATGDVVISLATTGGTLGGNTSATLVNGVAEFKNVTITGAGTHTFTFNMPAGISGNPNVTVTVAAPLTVVNFRDNMADCLPTFGFGTTFSADIDLNSISDQTITVVDDKGTAWPNVSRTLSTDRRSIIVAPGTSNPWTVGARYTVTFTTGLRSTNGAALSEAKTATFSVPGPTNSVKPTLSRGGLELGVDAVVNIGDELTCDPGTWSQPVAQFSYEWRRFDENNNAEIVGSLATYTVKSGDAGKKIDCNVKPTAMNDGYTLPAPDRLASENTRKVTVATAATSTTAAEPTFEFIPSTVPAGGSVTIRLTGFADQIGALSFLLDDMQTGNIASPIQRSETGPVWAGTFPVPANLALRSHGLGMVLINGSPVTVVNTPTLTVTAAPTTTSGAQSVFVQERDWSERTSVNITEGFGKVGDVAVEIRDAGGQALAGDVTVTIASGPPGAQLLGTTTATAAAGGAATFTDLEVSHSGSYTFSFRHGSLPAVTKDLKFAGIPTPYFALPLTAQEPTNGGFVEAGNTVRMSWSTVDGLFERNEFLRPGNEASVIRAGIREIQNRDFGNVVHQVLPVSGADGKSFTYSWTIPPSLEPGMYAFYYAPGFTNHFFVMGRPSAVVSPDAASVGTELSCVASWGDGAEEYTYQWRRDDAPILGATESKYTVTAQDAGRSITCAVTPSKAAGWLPGFTSLPANVPTGTSNAVRIAGAAAAATTSATIGSIAPQRGTTLGGDQVTITGTSGATSVTIGGAAATVTSITATSISVTTPAGTEGAKDIVVTTAAGPVTMASAFTYVGRPTITSIRPETGPMTGGTTIVITGTNLQDPGSLVIGGNLATNLSANEAGTEITATTPAGELGAKSISLVPGHGWGRILRQNAFEYVSAATLTVVVSKGTVVVKDRTGNKQNVNQNQQFTTGGDTRTLRTNTNTDTSLLNRMQALTNSLVPMNLTFSSTKEANNAQGQQVFAMTLGGQDFAKFVERSGGEAGLRENLKVVLLDPNGVTPATAPALQTITATEAAFKWTHPTGALAGRYLARPQFQSGPIGSLQAMFSVEPPPGTVPNVPGVDPAVALREQVDAALKGLFESYEQENASGFMRYIHSSFSGMAENRIALSASTIRSSIDEDFKNYNEIDFSWTVQKVNDFGGGNVEVQVQWDERLKAASTSAETLRLQKTSFFVFKRDASGLLLSGWSSNSAAAFGLSAPGGISTFQAGSTTPTGDIYATPGVLTITQNTTFSADLELGTGKTYHTAIVSPGVTITMASGTAIRILSGGTMTLGSGVTLTGSGAGWTGLVFSGSALTTQGPITISGAVIGIEVSSGSNPTISQSGAITISNCSSRAIKVNSGGTLSLANVTASGTGTVIESAGNLTLTSPTITSTGNNPVSLTGGGTTMITGSSNITGDGNVIDLQSFTGTLTVQNSTLTAFSSATNAVGFVTGSGTVNLSSLTTTGVFANSSINSAAGTTGTINLSGSNVLSGSAPCGIVVDDGTVQSTSGTTTVTGTAGLVMSAGVVSLVGLTNNAGGAVPNCVLQGGGDLTLSGANLSNAAMDIISVGGFDDLTITNSTVTASVGGSGLSFLSTGTLNISGGSYTFNNSGSCAGILFGPGATVSVSGATVTDNDIGISAQANGATINNCLVSGNTNPGIYVGANCTISGASGTSNGNNLGIEVNTGTATITGITISGNSAAGIRISAPAGNVTINAPAVTITGTTGGPGIDALFGTVNITGATISNNSTQGAIAGAPATINSGTTTYSDNSGIGLDGGAGFATSTTDVFTGNNGLGGVTCTDTNPGPGAGNDPGASPGEGGTPQWQNLDSRT